MKDFLIRLARWIFAYYDVELFAASPAVLDVLITARTVTSSLDLELDKSGEWKRHQAYATLLKLHPNTSKKDVALAIELALR